MTSNKYELQTNITLSIHIKLQCCEEQ